MNFQFGRKRCDSDRRVQRAFTLVELLTVIAIIGILAAIIVGSVNTASNWSKERRVRAELQELVTAIQSYQLAIGSYPPDTPGAPQIHTLYYELLGTSSSIAGGVVTYTTLDGRDSIANPSGAWSANFPSIGGILNAAPAANQGRPFLQNLKPNRHLANPASGTSVQFLVAPVIGTNSNDARFNPWRYVATNPTNNPKTFDLWAEVMIGGKIRVIGNWK